MEHLLQDSKGQGIPVSLVRDEPMKGRLRSNRSLAGAAKTRFVMDDGDLIRNINLIEV